MTQQFHFNIYPQELKHLIQKDTDVCTSVIIAPETKIWNQPRCLMTDE